MVANLFFDLDGTLLDIKDKYYFVYQLLINKFRGMPLNQSYYWKLKRNNSAWPVILEKSGLSPNLYPFFLSEFAAKIESPEALKKDKLFPGVIKLLRNYRRNYNLYLVTARKSLINTLRQISALKLKPLFADLYIGNEKKSAADSKHGLIKKIVNRQRDYLIGDSEADILAVRKLGINSVAVESGIRNRKFLLKLKPDNIICNINYLPTIISF